MSEEALILKLQKADEAAYKELFLLFKDKVYNSVLSILQNKEDAEDVLQEVFIQVFSSIHTFKQDSTLSTWIYRITVSKSLDCLRKKKRKKRFGWLENIFEPGTLEPLTDIPEFHHPGIVLEKKEQSALLFKALRQLPERQKIAYVLSKIEHLSQKEIALAMNTSVSSVESLLQRARQHLQALLENYYKNNF